MKKDKSINKITIAVVAVAMIIAITGGATFAYWQWTSNNAQQTQVNVTVDEGITMTITPTTASKSNMRPTNDCDGTYAMAATATVTINNLTGIKARPTFRLKAKATNALTSAIWGKINYAITEDGGSCSSPLAQGSFTSGSTGANTWYHTGDISGVTFDAAKQTTTTHTYDLYIWVDSTYTGSNTGGTVSDKLQNNTITVTWSENSTVAQVLS